MADIIFPFPTVNPTFVLCVGRAERKDFILSKYHDVHFVRRSHSSAAALRLGLQEATKSSDIYSLIHLNAQRTELIQPLQTHIQVHTRMQTVISTLCFISVKT